MSTVNSRKSRVGWVLCGDEQLASSRLQGFRVSEQLQALGCDSRIIATNAGELRDRTGSRLIRLAISALRANCDIVMFQKPEWAMFKLSQLLQLNGVRTIAIQCDPFVRQYRGYFDQTIVTSTRLRELLDLPDAPVIDDMVEVEPDKFKNEHASTGNRLRLVWVGQFASDWLFDFLDRLEQHPELRGVIEIVTIGRGPRVTHQWSLSTVHDRIIEADVAIIPMPESALTSSKSTNRLMQFLALGMPTIASPLPSYREAFESGAPLLLAESIDDFAHAVVSLRHQHVRQRLGHDGTRFARTHYDPRVVGFKWLEVIREVQSRSSRPDALSVDTGTKMMARLLGSMVPRIQRQA
jgi:glycosyltransferase involved in cell wall biosynthesis